LHGALTRAGDEPVTATEKMRRRTFAKDHAATGLDISPESDRRKKLAAIAADPATAATEPPPDRAMSRRGF
jgi:hypothetical protein